MFTRVLLAFNDVHSCFFRVHSCSACVYSCSPVFTRAVTGVLPEIEIVIVNKKKRFLNSCRIIFKGISL